MSDHVTQNELKANIDPIRNSMTELSSSISNLNDKFGAYLEQSIRLDHHAQDIRELKDQSKILTTHKTETHIYWKLFGFVGSILLAAIVKLMFFP